MAGWHLPPFPPWPPDDGQAGQSTPAPDSRRRLFAIFYGEETNVNFIMFLKAYFLIFQIKDWDKYKLEIGANRT